MVIIGAGNVAWHLGHCFANNGIKIVQVVNRTESKGMLLANSLGAAYTDSIRNADTTADLYLIAISDDAIGHFIDKDLFKVENKIVVHTAGGVNIDVFAGKARNYGILYPLQSFSKDRPVEFRTVPFLVEANNMENLVIIKTLASKLSEYVYHVDSIQRLYIHLSAVIASNFTNHLFTISERILRDQKLSFDLLKPLIRETVLKAMEMPPAEAQTGPAIRGNDKVIERHLAVLQQYPEIREVYKILTKSIQSC